MWGGLKMPARLSAGLKKIKADINSEIKDEVMMHAGMGCGWG